MAITINYEPSGFHSAHNPMYIELQSNNSTQAQFKYIFDIYVNGAFASRQRVFPDPSDDKGYLNISNVVRDYFDIAKQVVTAGSITPVELNQGEFFVDFYGIYGEDYSGSPFVSGTASGGNYKAYNWTKSRFQRKIQDAQTTGNNFFNSFEDYQEHFLTNRPQNTKYYAGQPLILGFWWGATTPIDIWIDNFSPNSTVELMDEMVFENPKIFDVGSSPDTNSSSFRIRAAGPLQPSGNLASLTFVKECHPRYEPVTLMFLNRLGGWDSYTFGLFNQISLDIDKKSFMQNPYVGRSDLIGGGFVRESTKVFAVQYKNKWKLTGDNLTTEEYVWLEELFTSPLVYVYIEDSLAERQWHPVVISETNYTLKNNLSDKQNFIELTVEFAEPNNSQYR